jgi:hypothetical protein
VRAKEVAMASMGSNKRHNIGLNKYEYPSYHVSNTNGLY